ncbi:PleD family two-component system response regulator [candidate division CSSED10-310 bacterium]|uniref:PleD family two-component system response regulator n=1 Tax=candidate division CSSED10-310 bacterium TaxID=2855610 RepID=A0ABV6Z3W5_UNCC1
MTAKKVLVVDDDHTILERVAHILKQNKYHVILAHDGEKGLITAMKSPPDLIILDVEMPKMRGWEVCKILKQNKLTASIPIIILTSRSELSDILVAMQQGADDYLPKPFEDSELLRRVDRLIDTTV